MRTRVLIAGLVLGTAVAAQQAPTHVNSPARWFTSSRPSNTIYMTGIS